MKDSGRHGHGILSLFRSADALACGALFFIALFVTSSAPAQTLTVLHSFNGLDGAEPAGELALDELGHIYGTTQHGGTALGDNVSGGGTLFELFQKPDGSWTQHALYKFGVTASDGMAPTGPILRYQSSTYGATAGGGGAECATQVCGTIYQVGKGTETILHSFTGQDGKLPWGGLTRDSAGNFYGTTVLGAGGTFPANCGFGCGTVYEVTGGQLNILYSFTGRPDGVDPIGRVVPDRAGNLYGTTEYGGAFNSGIVFELSPNLDGTWTEQVLYNFTGGSDGAYPSAIAVDLSGNLYGTTMSGGNAAGACQFGCGVLFKLTPTTGGQWEQTVLHAFGDTPTDGQTPAGNLLLDRHGNLFGVTNRGGASNAGTAYELQSQSVYTVLHSFSGVADGAYPSAGLISDAVGNLYGTTNAGGTSCTSVGGCGTVFRIAP